MFKIVENGDGSTSVFDKQTGQLLCRVPKKSSAVAVGKPLIRTHVKPCIRDLKRFPASLPKEYSPVEKKKRIEAWADCASTSDRNSFVSSSGSESSEDASDECVDQYSFLKSFDLINSSELRCKTVAELRRTFPRRAISRAGALLPASASVLRPFDDVELCSPLGLRFCRLRHRLTPGAVEQAAKKYEKYCKISVLTPHPNLTLRQRESIKFGVTFRPTRSRLGPSPSTHLYSFTSRERRERYLQLVTGLNRRSRAVLKRCRTLCVCLRRLSPREVEQHTKRRKQLPDAQSDDDDCVVIAEVIRTAPQSDCPQQAAAASRQSSLMDKASVILDRIIRGINSIVSLARE